MDRRSRRALYEARWCQLLLLQHRGLDQDAHFLYKYRPNVAIMYPAI